MRHVGGRVVRVGVRGGRARGGPKQRWTDVFREDLRDQHCRGVMFLAGPGGGGMSETSAPHRGGKGCREKR